MATVLLICAVLASLAFGVLLAYGICHTMFRIFRVQSIQAAKRRSQMASPASSAVTIA